ncbi:MAG: hypothetical protein GC149_05935 [Gammaproteobacteria bacterium]|nr:hypothetical protein [Gammaproteobacteria bacterium]
MFAFKSHIQIHRGGKQYRCNRYRFFYIRRVGWFVRTRGEMEISEGMELFDGIAGPFPSRDKARFHLMQLIYEQEPELFAGKPFETLKL